MTDDCTCIECCEFRMARDEDQACAQMFDYAVDLYQRTRKDWEHATTRFRKAIQARNAVHTPGHPATNRTEQQ